MEVEGGGGLVKREDEEEGGGITAVLVGVEIGGAGMIATRSAGPSDSVDVDAILLDARVRAPLR